jgi:hypothetical protein
MAYYSIKKINLLKSLGELEPNYEGMMFIKSFTKIHYLLWWDKNHSHHKQLFLIIALIGMWNYLPLIFIHFGKKLLSSCLKIGIPISELLEQNPQNAKGMDLHFVWTWFKSVLSYNVQMYIYGKVIGSRNLLYYLIAHWVQL